jgi:hypothetical membrane protein
LQTRLGEEIEIERTETMAERQRRKTDMMMRWLAAFGIATLILDVLLTIGLAALDPQYSHSRQYISELGEDGRPYAAVFNAWSFIYGLLLAGFAVSLGRGLNSRPVLITCLAIAACSVATGAFPCDQGCAGETPAAKVHMATGYVSFPAIILAPWFAWFAMRKSELWRGYRALTLAVAILLLASTGWLVACHFTGREQEGCAVGVAQRLVVGILYTWMVAVAVRIWTLAGQLSMGSGDFAA